MDAKNSIVNGAAVKRAIESRDGRMLSSFYADDALLPIVDRNNPPSRPREVKGRPAISAFWDDICSRAMTHKVETSVAQGDQLAFSQVCTYPDGMKVRASPFAISRAARSRSKPSCRPGTSNRRYPSKGKHPCSSHVGRSTPASGTSRP